MNKADLVKLGVSEDVADQVIVLHGKDIEKFKATITERETTIADLQKQAAETAKTLKGFQDMDIDGIKKAAAEWQSKAEQAQKDADAKIDQMRFDTALDAALAGAKAKNPKAVRALLTVDDLKLAKDGSISGLDKQLEKVREENDFLFEPAEEGEPAPKIVTGTKPKSVLPGDVLEKAMRKAAGLEPAKQ